MLFQESKVLRMEFDSLINIRPAQENRSRGVELLDLTIALSHGPRLRELLRAREVMCDFFAGDNVYQSTTQQMMRYYDVFAFVK